MNLIIALATLLLMVLQANSGIPNAGDLPAATPVTTTLTGVVVDSSTGEPLTGVAVGINGKEVKTYTDFNGYFSLSNLAPGEYHVYASLISYQSQRSHPVTLTANANSNLEIQLESIK